jgi:hypothetical protein
MKFTKRSRATAEIELISKGNTLCGPKILKQKVKSKVYKSEEDVDENSYRVIPQTPYSEKFFAIAI